MKILYTRTISLRFTCQTASRLVLPLFLFFTHTSISQIIIRDSVAIAPKLQTQNISVKTTSEVVDKGPLYTSRYVVSSSQISATGVRRVFLNATNVFEMVCNPGGYGGTFFGSDPTVVTSLGEVTVQAFKCVSGVYTSMTVTKTQNSATSATLFFNGKIGGELTLIPVPMPTLAISPRNVIVEVREDYQPVIQFSETHKPPTGDTYSPAVTWLTNNAIATADYYWRFADEDTIPVYISAKAENIRGSVTITETARLTVRREPTKVEFQASEDSLFAGDYTMISDLKIYDQFTRVRNWPNEVHITAEPFGYGYFKLEYQDPYTHEPAEYIFTDQYLSHTFLTAGQLTFVAQNADPLSDIPVKVRIGMVQTYDEETGDPVEVSHEVPLVVKSEKLCPVVELSDSSVSPGDTIQVMIKGKDENGNIVDWHSTATVFKIEISNGNEYGDLLIGGNRYEEYDGVNKETPIFFIADTANIPDSVTTIIRALLSTAPLPAQALSAKADVATTLGVRGNRKALVVAPPPPEPLCDNTAEVKFSGLDHFEIVYELDTLAYTEETKILVTAKDEDDNNFDLNPNTEVTFSLEINSEYATFIYQEDTIKSSPVRVSHIPYSDAKEGKVRLAAIIKNPTDMLKCKVMVYKSGNQTKFGEEEIPVVEQTLKIVMEAPFEVLPTKLLGNPNQQIVDENRKAFTIQLTRNKSAVRNHRFNLKSDYVDGTGGHDHINRRRPTDTQTQRRENYGYFIRTRDKTVHDSRPFSSETQADGRERFDFVASMFGDSMRITVESSDPVKKKFLRDSVTIAEKVPSLVQLGDGINYDLIGGTCDHIGPDDNSSCRSTTVDHDHYANIFVVTMIQEIARRYNEVFPIDPSLKINDMSLPFGGRFDINANWAGYSEHQYHRFGMDVDIRRGGGIPPENEERFKIICRENGVINPDPENDEHFHLYFWKY